MINLQNILNSYSHYDKSSIYVCHRITMTTKGNAFFFGANFSNGSREKTRVGKVQIFFYGKNGPESPHCDRKKI